MRHKEDYFISLFQNKHIGDDGAFIKPYVYASDSFFEGVHFTLDFGSLHAIARKSMLVNISDAIVMNAKVKYILLNCAIPAHYTNEQLKQLAQGFLDTANEYGAIIIGGDTIQNDKLAITITTISYCIKPVFRHTIRDGDLIAHTGSLGSVQRDLRKVLRFNKLGKNSKLISLKLNPDFFYEASRHIRSALDISDGLSKELHRLSKLGRIGFHFYKPICQQVSCSGEEYEILFSFSPQHKQRFIYLAKKHRIKLNIFAQAKKYKAFKNPCQANHF
mgnify:CR=1 FL=1